MFTVFLGVGTNMGNIQENIDQAVWAVKSSIGEVIAQSSTYETEPWGVENQANYYNIVVKAETTLLPLQLLEEVQAIEHRLGRVRKEKWGSRVIDIDILMFEDYHFSMVDLIIPHAFLHKRNFVLHPLTEIASNFIHPKFNLSIKMLKELNPDKSWIKKIT